MTDTILVVDDKANVRMLLQEHLTQQGYRVISADNGRNALFTARHQKPSLILLDIMMPEMDGYQFLTQYRRESNVPVIIITARDEETDAVLGLELGADDYVIKPFRMRELMARIRAVMRRTDQDSPTQKILRSGDLALDKDTHTVTRANKLVHLTPIEFDLLEIMMSSPGQVYTRDSLMERLSDSGFAGYERTINVHIRNLRAKIETDSANPMYIETIFGVGYRFHKEGVPE